MERHEFAVGDQQAKRRAILHQHGGEAIVRANAQKIAVAHAGFGLGEFVAHLVAETERVDDILPVGAGKNERFAVGLLPGEQFAFEAKPGIEMDVFDAAHVVDAVH